VQADEWEDRVDTVSRTMLGLTVACARCHDHKFDPILSRDYYALAGVFASTKMVNKTPDGVIDDKAKKAAEMMPAALHIVEDGEPKNLNVFIRGNVERKARWWSDASSKCSVAANRPRLLTAAVGANSRRRLPAGRIR
jgi:hypothetical protein